MMIVIFLTIISVRKLLIVHLSTGLPDFAKVYNFIGSVFDPDTKGRLHELKDMDPINLEPVSIVVINNI